MLDVEGTAVDSVGLRPAKLDRDLHLSIPRSPEPVDGCATPVAVPVTVNLLGKEPDVGLGFDVTGDQTGAVFVREVFEHGPAIQTGKIKPGDLE